ncbi:hypothetical protein HAX54_042115 [Datura stramonium]|uniref:Histone-lysine N-methyltransferase ASHH3 n=1 Tax=Datura stramonium TaxID=4076 RepID=A0ABS8SM44_DATST|nr:hypothetical protein [Datura stramonium]
MPAAKKSATHGGIGHVFDKLTSEIGDPVDFELPDCFFWPFSFSICVAINYLKIYTSPRRLSGGWKMMAYLVPAVQQQDLQTCVAGIVFEYGRGRGTEGETGGLAWCGGALICGGWCFIQVAYQLAGWVFSMGREAAFDYAVSSRRASMLWSSCSSGCKCGSSCLNKPFHQRPVKKMKIVKTEKCGYGIVADEDIKRKEFIIEYVGEVIDDKTCEERLWKMKDSGETNFYLCEINRDMVIDATYKGNKSRYINHSCCPNTEMQRWMIDGETRIGIFAKRDIRKGEHLTYDYQFVQFGADQDCHCGAIECKRKLGIKPNKLKLSSSDAALKLVASQVAASSPKLKALVSAKHDYQTGVPPKGSWNCDSAWTQRPHNCIGQVIRIIGSSDRRSFGIIKRFNNSTKKHLIMFEDGSVENLDMSKEEWEFCDTVLIRS